MKKLLIGGLTLAAITIFACKKNDFHNVPYSKYGTEGIGFLKINWESPYAANPKIQLSVNGKRVSNLLSYRGPYPGGGYNTSVNPNLPLYLAVPTGSDTLNFAIPKSGTDIDSVLLYQTIVNIDTAYYTIHVADTSTKTKSVLVKNDMSVVPSGFTRFRFINLIPNVTGTNGAVDLYLNEVKIASNVPYMGVTDTFSVRTGLNAPGVPPGSTTAPTPQLKIRTAGANPGTKSLDSLSNANILQSSRALSIFCEGYIGQAKGNRGPYITLALDK